MSKIIDLKKIIYVIILGVAMEIVASFLLEKVLVFFPEIAIKYSQMISEMTVLSVSTVFFVVVMAPIFEETIFRFLIMGGVNKLLPFIAANIIQAFLFGLYHMNLVQGIYAFILGLYIGYIKKIFGGIIYCIVFHMSLNLSGLFVDKVFGNQSELIILICFIISAAIAAIITYNVKREEKCTDGLSLTNS